MKKIVGTTNNGVIYTDNTNQHGIPTFSLTELSHEDNAEHFRLHFDFKNLHYEYSDAHSNCLKELTHVSVLPIHILSHDLENSTKFPRSNKELEYLLISSVCKLTFPNTTKYSASIFLASVSRISGQINVLQHAEVFEMEFNNEIKIYFLPACSKVKKQNEEGDEDSTEHYNSGKEAQSDSVVVTTRAVFLVLEENILLYDIRAWVSEAAQKLEVFKRENVAKAFCWAQWLPHQEAVAYVHFRQPRLSSFDDDEEAEKPKPFLTVLQFHRDFPRESVLNMPVEQEVEDRMEDGNRLVMLTKDPNILCSVKAQIKLLAHPSGAVYLFHIFPTSTLTSLNYSVKMLHHNKTLDVIVNLHECLPKIRDASIDISLDVGLYSRDNYLIVVGWPAFVHMLDIGSTHEPSHHFVFDSTDFPPQKTFSDLMCIFDLRNRMSNDRNLKCDEKTDLSPKYSSTTKLVFDDLSVINIELNSAMLLPMIEKRSPDINFKLAVLHFFLVHLGDINVSKRIVYDEGKKTGNLLLKKIYQEFLIGHAHLQTRKQILPNLESFVYLIPYSADPEEYSSLKSPSLSIQTLKPQPRDVSIMLLSPSQRVFPHSITDLWTALWNLNKNFTRSTRFCHKDLAEKLVLSLQCYKPEALSRASTPGPMSPSSPLICTSLGDLVGMFGRRATELQLPFLEQESCTANKQEYIFSINLREMSMHLLKERKEWPLHGHSVAGKYVSALGDTARLLCHLVCLTAHLQPTRAKDKGFHLIDSLERGTRLKLFMLMENYTLALGRLACPLPQGFTPFFVYLGYRVLKYNQFLWHVRAGTFEIYIDTVKTIMADMPDDIDDNIVKKLQLLSLLPKTRANRILNAWSHSTSIAIRARQHASDLLSGSVSQNRKRIIAAANERKKSEASVLEEKDKFTPLDTFVQLLTAKASASDIDVGLLTQATLVSMDKSS